MKKNPTKDIYKLLYQYIKPHMLTIAIVLLALLTVTGSILFLGQGIRNLIDNGLSAKNIINLNQVVASLFGLIFILALASYFRSSNINLLCEKIELAIKKDAFSNLIGLSPEFYESYKTSDIISRLTNDLAVINSIVSTTLSFALRNSIMLLGGIIFLIATDWKVTAYVLLILPLALAPIILLGRRIKAYSRVNQTMVSTISAKIEESFNNIKTIQSFGHEDHEINIFSSSAEELYSFAKKRITARAIMFALVIMIVLASILFVLWIGGMDVISGRMSAGDLSSFIYYSVIVASSTGGLSEVFGDLQRAKASVERVIELLKYRAKIVDGKLKNPSYKNYNIEFDQVIFNYPTRPENLALDEFSAQFIEGKSYALVGKSGAGKTTIFELLLRFYDHQAGRITIGGINIKDLKLSSLRGLIGVVPQDPVIFSMTALENIRFGREDASLDEVKQAAKVAEIYDFIMGLPQGFDTYLGEKGVRISGGQKQRIAIARAVLKDPKILLLDEATSSLDSTNEQLVLKAIEKVTKNRTTITIAHRISTVKKADQIILLDGGKVLEIGTHDQLYNKSELYKQLWDMQSNLLL